MGTLLTFHPHGFSLVLFVQHLTLDGIATAGGYYASRFCPHRRHRLAVAVAFTLVSTLALVALVG